MFTKLLGILGLPIDIWFVITILFMMFVILCGINSILKKRKTSNKFTENFTEIEETVFDKVEQGIYFICDLPIYLKELAIKVYNWMKEDGRLLIIQFKNEIKKYIEEKQIKSST